MAVSHGHGPARPWHRESDRRARVRSHACIEKSRRLVSLGASLHRLLRTLASETCPMKVPPPVVRTKLVRPEVKEVRKRPDLPARALIPKSRPKRSRWELIPPPSPRGPLKVEAYIAVNGPAPKEYETYHRFDPPLRLGPGAAVVRIMDDERTTLSIRAYVANPHTCAERRRMPSSTTCSKTRSCAWRMGLRRRTRSSLPFTANEPAQTHMQIGL